MLLGNEGCARRSTNLRLRFLLAFVLLFHVQPQLNYIQAAVDTVMTIVKGEGRGDVLAFLPGMEVHPSRSASHVFCLCAWTTN